MHSLKASIAVGLCLSSSVASAQTMQTPNPQQPLVAAANSFTGGQVQKPIEKAGFSEVKGLKKDDQGIWRGTAKRGDRQVNVALDFEGSVAANQ